MTNPESLQSRLDRVQVLHDLGKLDHAIEEAGRVVVDFDNSADAHYGLAICLNQAGHIPQAKESCQRALALDPDHFGALMLATDFLDSSAAKRVHMRHIATLYPQSAHALAGLAWLEQSNPRSRHAQVKDLIEKALSLEPHDVWVLTTASRIYHSIDRKRSQELLAQALELDPSNSLALSAKALHAEQMPMVEDAANAVTAALAVSPGDEILESATTQLAGKVTRPLAKMIWVVQGGTLVIGGCMFLHSRNHAASPLEEMSLVLQLGLFWIMMLIAGLILLLPMYRGLGPLRKEMIRSQFRFPLVRYRAWTILAVCVTTLVTIGFTLKLLPVLLVSALGIIARLHIPRQLFKLHQRRHSNTSRT